jgi:hypothetical protein
VLAPIFSNTTNERIESFASTESLTHLPKQYRKLVLEQQEARYGQPPCHNIKKYKMKSKMMNLLKSARKPVGTGLFMLLIVTVFSMMAINRRSRRNVFTKESFLENISYSQLRGEVVDMYYASDDQTDDVYEQFDAALTAMEQVEEDGEPVPIDGVNGLFVGSIGKSCQAARQWRFLQLTDTGLSRNHPHLQRSCLQLGCTTASWNHPHSELGECCSVQMARPIPLPPHHQSMG